MFLEEETENHNNKTCRDSEADPPSSIALHFREIFFLSYDGNSCAEHVNSERLLILFSCQHGIGQSCKTLLFAWLSKTNSAKLYKTNWPPYIGDTAVH